MSHPDPPRVPIPLTWLESSFNTRARTEQLLRPELHDGILTQHDFDAAVDFFPGAQRYYSIAGGIIGALSFVVYGQILRRPPFPIHRIGSLSAVASAGGAIGGTIMRAKAHADFFRNLDNQPAFFQAIDNIQVRLGEKPPGQHTTPAHPYPGSDDELPEMTDSAVGSWEGTAVNKAVVGPKPSPAQPSQHKSRWEDIRAEHSRSMTTRSSWDELRQNASRPKSENTGSDHADSAVDTRLAEQQKFDALIEAERQRAARG